MPKSVFTVPISHPGIRFCCKSCTWNADALHLYLLETLWKCFVGERWPMLVLTIFFLSVFVDVLNSFFFFGINLTVIFYCLPSGRGVFLPHLSCCICDNYFILFFFVLFFRFVLYTVVQKNAKAVSLSTDLFLRVSISFRLFKLNLFMFCRRMFWIS